MELIKDMLMENRDQIGKHVLSSDFGVGIITGIDHIGGDDQEFFIVEHEHGKARSFISCAQKLRYRFLADKSEWESTIKATEYDVAELKEMSKSERINFFKSQSKNQTLTNMFGLLLAMTSFEDLGTVEISIRTKILDSLALELSLIQNIPTEDAQSIIKGDLVALKS